MGEKSHRNLTTFQESFVCLFPKRPKENQKWPPPSLSVSMKILQISLTSEVGRHWGCTAGRSGSTRTMELRSWLIKTGEIDLRFKFRVAQQKGSEVFQDFSLMS